jgi:hypothetical protein
MFVEAGISDDFPSDPFEESDADTVLAWLKGAPLEDKVVKRRTFIG